MPLHRAFWIQLCTSMGSTFSPQQIEIVEREGERPYLLYTEDISKNHPGGLKGRKIRPKAVRHYANVENPDRCFIRLFKLYLSRCPSDTPKNALYLKPLTKPTQACWYSKQPLGHNKLSQTVSRLCKAAGIEGYRTNHSLRATNATRLYAHGVDEQIIMEQTGHSSVEGVRSYKHMSEAQQMVISNVLNCAKRPRALSLQPSEAELCLPSHSVGQLSLPPPSSSVRQLSLPSTSLGQPSLPLPSPAVLSQLCSKHLHLFREHFHLIHAHHSPSSISTVTATKIHQQLAVM